MSVKPIFPYYIHFFPPTSNQKSGSKLESIQMCGANVLISYFHKRINVCLLKTPFWKRP